MEAPGPLRDRIAAELRLGRSPAAVCADLDAENVPGRPCCETLYQAVYSGALGVKPAVCLRTRRRLRTPPRRQEPQATTSRAGHLPVARSGR